MRELLDVYKRQEYMYSVIILCAGKGTRTGLDYNKMLYEFNGKTVYEMTLENFIHDSKCGQIIVVTQPFERKLFERISKDSRIEFADGGQERQDSVYEGLKKTKGDYVLIHDGARPFVKRKHIDALLECLKVHSACLLMVPCNCLLFTSCLFGIHLKMCWLMYQHLLN